MSLVEPEELAHMSDVFLFLGKEVNNSYTGSNIGDSCGSAGKEMVIGKGNGKSNVSGVSTVALSAHSEGYTLGEMTPDMIHAGPLPQLVLDQENEFVEQSNNDNEHIQMAAKIADNGMKAYRRTRSEASHHGVTLAKKLIKGDRLVNIHPLISGEDPERCNKDIIEQTNFIRVLQTFRPATTVFETGGTQATGSQTLKNGRGRKRRTNKLDCLRAIVITALRL